MNTTKKPTKPKSKTKNVNSTRKQTTPKTTDKTQQRGGGGCFGKQIYPVFNISTQELSKSTPVVIFNNELYDIPMIDHVVDLDSVEAHISYVKDMVKKKDWEEADFDKTRELLKKQFNFDDTIEGHLQKRSELNRYVYELKQKYYTQIKACNANSPLLNLPEDLKMKISTFLPGPGYAEKLSLVAKDLAKTVDKFHSDLKMIRRSDWRSVEDIINKQTLSFFGRLKSAITLILDKFTWLCLNIPLILTRTIKRTQKIIAMPFVLHIDKGEADSDLLEFTVQYGNTYDQIKFKGRMNSSGTIQELSISNINDQSFTTEFREATDWTHVCSSWIAFQACKVLNVSCINFADQILSERLSQTSPQPFLTDIRAMYENMRTAEAPSVHYLVQIFDFYLTRSDDAETAVRSAINTLNNELTGMIPDGTQTALFDLIEKARTSSSLVDTLDKSFTELDRRAPRAMATPMPGVVNHHLYEQEAVPVHFHVSLTTQAQGEGGRRKNKQKQVYVKSKDEVIYKGKTYKIYCKVNSKGGNAQYIKIKNQDTKTFEYKRVKK